MEPRTMPQATFRCDVCSAQESALLTAYARGQLGEFMRPHPIHHAKPMRLVQLDYHPAVS